jgi:hypothetical protein
MPSEHSSPSSGAGGRTAPEQHADAQHADAQHGRAMTCTHCMDTLECVEQNRRSGTWVGSFICPNCRSEYFYAYRWGTLSRKESLVSGS